ncbi:hypothetical protein F511_34887 [Dorcoceras hygrometricum]|uniref:Uncharacterized protein n=1 Tax=Dorcoceras hygrometricum TaxID=472368 RepID=A0A2Z7AP96_9LAMI|nr:hypothetical protein F511_34887 [Dorcoceras hygrometricum]
MRYPLHDVCAGEASMCAQGRRYTCATPADTCAHNVRPSVHTILAGCAGCSHNLYAASARNARAKYAVRSHNVRAVAADTCARLSL